MIVELPVEEAIPDIRIEETPAPEQPQVVAAVSPPVSVADIEEEVPMVEMTLAIPMSAADFDESAQNRFRMAVGQAAGVPGDKVYILEIKDISGRRQSPGIEVRTAIQTESASSPAHRRKASRRRWRSRYSPQRQPRRSRRRPTTLVWPA